MKANKASDKFKSFQKSLKRLGEILDVPKNHTGRIDATIKRFEFCFELCWKTLKIIIEQKGGDAPFPREVIKKSYRAGWIDDEKLWLDMLDDRNITAYSYDETVAKEIAGHIPKYYKALQALSKKMLKLIEEK